MARVYALKEGEENFAKIRLYIKNEGAEALNKFEHFKARIRAIMYNTEEFGASYTVYNVVRLSNAVQIANVE